MLELPIKKVPKRERDVTIYAASLVHALARDEAAGRRTARLTEKDHATWNRFRGRLQSRDFVELLFEDAAVLHRVPFQPERVEPDLSLSRLGDESASAWLSAIADLNLSAPSPEYILAQAKLLGVPTRMARSDLHVIKPHHKVLELPGTGGQLAHHLVTTQDDLKLQDSFTIAGASWQELTLAGIVSLDLGTPHSDFVVRVEADELKDPEHAIRKARFDFVIGLAPEKGGAFQAEEQLSIWFSDAKIVLV